MYGCVLPTTSIVHQLDDKRPAGDDSCSSRKEVSVAEEEANLEKDTHACTHAQQTDARLPCIVRRTCIFGLEHVHTAAVRNLLKVSRAQSASEFLGFPLRRSASSAKNKTQENSDIFDQYKNG